ncbi:pentatricopeptide repeat-containing protein At4g04370-like isoform X1 [Selaginella moellendorffii]|uniref:pentatricopeptide repeat-containing protein At4g04370-like isoform X1 n=1 Tax=Selaginella moellendorffii TaxID=88036 RepID=UPI000D1C2EE9|nr:pentatricopeptide repeat-containing protein At4g04370-like isoform X1 [Selaginella moellendorffii]|eukprot:XP_024520331.1 pentatricopeptide repeat-containing protein At4g04370-like isoform X1 [Selaginella moellendorffii]
MDVMAAATFLSATIQDSQVSKAQEELQWRQLFEDPSLWWDNRNHNLHGSQHDFKHAQSGATLTIASSFCPKWAKLGLKCLKVSNFKARAQYRDGEEPIFEKKTQSTDSDGTRQSKSRSNQHRESVSSLVAALKACTGSRNWARGMKLHAVAVENGKDSNIFVASSLVGMYSKCGRMEDARKVFDGMQKRDAVSWNTVILGYAENGDGETALELFEKMQAEDHLSPDSWTIVSALKACSSLAAAERSREVFGELVKIQTLEKGMAVHSLALKNRCDSDRFVASGLVDMYSKCGSLSSARAVFDGFSDKDVALWNAMILGYAENGSGDLGLKLFVELIESDVEPNARTFVAALKACTDLAATEQSRKFDGTLVKAKALEEGLALHSRAVEKQLEADIFVSNMLVDVYAKCGSMALSRGVFDRMRTHDVISWTALLSGYCDNGEEEEALELISRMLQDPGRCSPNARTFVAAFKACANLAAKEDAQVVAGKLVKMVSLERGTALHVEAAKSGFASDLFVSNTLIDMYAKCGALEAGRSVFERMKIRAPASYNALMLGYVDSGEAEEALALFERMSCEPDARTYVAALKACTILASREQGKEISGKLVKAESLGKARGLFDRAVKGGFFPDLFVANTLIDVFAKCGDLEEARRIFYSMKQRDVVSWNVLMLGLAERDQGKLALELFEEMKSQAQCDPDSRTYVAALKACASVGALEMGRALHEVIRELGLDESDGILATSLVDFYSRCGSMSEAREVFDSIKAPKDVVAWNSLLAGYGRQGGGDNATGTMLDVFSQMRERGVKPVGITYLCLLTACSHAGLIDEAQRLFDEMWSKNGIKPGLEHYHCLIDALGRANRIEEALAMADRMPHAANCVTWTMILSACHKWKNSRVGRIAFDALQRLDCKESAAYVLMGNTL